MALNICTFLQSASGDFHQGWEYDRAFRLDEAGNPVGNTGVARAELIRAFHKSRNRLNLPQTIFNGLCQSTLGQIQTLMETPEAERRGGSLMGIGLLLNWATEDQTSG